MKKYLFCLSLFLFNTSFASDNFLRFRNDNPDLIFQMRAGEKNRQFIFNQLRESFKLFYNVDLLKEEIDLPLIELNEGLVLEDYLDKKLATILKKSLRFSLNQVSTKLDVYKLNYKLGRPVFKLKSSLEADKYIDVLLEFDIKSIDIDVENILITNSSPGVSLSGQSENNGKIRVTGKENMTLIDDIYLRLVSPSDKPMLNIESGNDGAAVASGEIKIRIHKNGADSLSLEYLGHDLKFFDGQDAEVLANKIKIYLSEGSKIGGIDGIEFGKRELKFKTDVKDLISKKRVFIMNMIKDPVADAIKNSDFTQVIADEINSIRLDGSMTLALKNNEALNGMQIKADINSIGFINSQSDEDQQLHISTNNSVSWLHNLFQAPEILPFPFSNPANHQLSQDLITADLKSGNSDVIISFGQDHINHMILNATKGIIPIPNDPTTKKDDLIKSGKKGVFYILEDKQAAQGKIVLDILIKPNFFQSVGLAIATFRSKLYFPLIISPEITLEMNKNTPTLVFKVKDIDMTEETLRKGLYGVSTNLGKGINRKLVIKKIKQQLAPFIGSTIYSMPIPQFEGLNLGRVIDLNSDGLGRLNLKLKLEEVDEDTRKIADELPNLIYKIVQNK